MTAAAALASAPPARRVLIVEDEVLIGLVLEDMLELMGHTVVGNVASLDEAEPILDAGFDLAILDVHIGGEPVFPLADRVAATGASVLFSTGSSGDSLPERFRNWPLLAKPYSFDAVAAALAAVSD